MFTCSGIVKVIQSRRLNWNEHLGHIGETRNTCSIFVKKRPGNDEFETVKRNGNSIKMDVIAISFSNVDYIEMDQDSIQWQALVLGEFNLKILISHS